MQRIEGNKTSARKAADLPCTADLRHALLQSSRSLPASKDAETQACPDPDNTGHRPAGKTKLFAEPKIGKQIPLLSRNAHTRAARRNNVHVARVWMVSGSLVLRGWCLRRSLFPAYTG